MTRFSRSFAASGIGALLLLTTATLPQTVRACASVGAANTRVQVVDESALILWDAAKHQERFIRRATFDARADNFGFLVPTPARPTLRETDGRVFRSLENIIRPRVMEQKHVVLTPFSLLFPPLLSKSRWAETASLSARPGGMGVTVLDTQHVGGYDAVVLAADDAGTLQKWLQSHNYSADPALQDWLRPYIQAHWTITAFKISKDNPRTAYASSAAVEMAFTTSRPFFPYREPANQRVAGNYSPRSLRVFVLSDTRMEGRLGDSLVPVSWPGDLFSARTLAGDQRAFIAKALSLSTETPSTPLWLSTFVDRSYPRPGTDEVYFTSASQQTTVEPPPITVSVAQHIYLPIEPLVLMAGAGLFFGIRWRRKHGVNMDRRPALRDRTL